MPGPAAYGAMLGAILALFGSLKPSSIGGAIGGGPAPGGPIGSGGPGGSIAQREQLVQAVSTGVSASNERRRRYIVSGT